MKVAAARDHVDSGLTKAESMAEARGDEHHDAGALVPQIPRRRSRSLETQGQTKRREIQAQTKTDARVGTHGGGFLPEGENRVPEKGPGPTGVEVAKRKKAPSCDNSQGKDTGLTTPSK